MDKKIRVIQYGCGNIGKLCIQKMYEKGYEIVGAIDAKPDLVGKDVGEIAGLSCKLGVTVTDNADELLQKVNADVAILTLFSEMERIAPFIEKCVSYGINVITSADQFSSPYAIAPDIANQLDVLAKEKGYLF